VNVINVEQLPL